MSLFGKFRQYIETSLDARISESLKKMEVAQATVVTPTITNSENDLQKKEKSDGWGRKGLLFDAFQSQDYTSGSIRQKAGFVSNTVLKIAARKNAIISIIVNTHANQVKTFCKKQENHYADGYTFDALPGFEADPEEQAILTDFIQNCGFKEGRSNEDKMTFDMWGYSVCSDFERYGHAAIERLWFADGQLRGFLPLDAGITYHSSTRMSSKQIRDEVKQWQKTLESWEKGFTATTSEDEDLDNPVEYVQYTNGRTTADFTRKEMIFALLNPENDIDLHGYAISPLERALQMTTNQLKVENHQASCFTHGFASKGVFVIQGDVAPATQRALQQQWNAQVSGPGNAWRTPILSGIQGATWIPLAMNNRDMEYAAYQDHLIRVMHGCFGIDPEETGFGYLSRGTEQRSLGESSNEWKVTASRDRGLRPILTRIAAIINEEVLPYAFPELSKKYVFKFAGLDAETRAEETQRLAEEVSVHKTIGDARREAGMQPLPYVNNLILNPLLVQTLSTTLPFGVFAEVFLGLEGASERPDMQFINNPGWFQWMQFQMQTMQQASMADQGDDDGPPPKKKGGKPDKKKDSKGPSKGSSEDQDDADAVAQRKQQMAAAAAAQKFIRGNPHLFKSLSNNLFKSTATHRRLAGVRNQLVDEYERASNRLVRDILEVVKEEIEGGERNPKE